MAFLETESSKKGLIRAGAIAFLVAGILTIIQEIVTFLLTLDFLNTQATISYGISTNLLAKIAYALITPIMLPSTTAATIQFVTRNVSSFLIIYTLSAVTSVILLLGILVLYYYLRKIKPASIVLTSLFALIFLVIAVLGSMSLMLVIGTSFSLAHSTADFKITAFITSYIGPLYIASAGRYVSGFVLDPAFLVISAVMLRSQIRKYVGGFGIVISILGVISAIVSTIYSSVDLAEVLNVLFAVWFFMLAYSLWQVGSGAGYKLPAS